MFGKSTINGHLFNSYVSLPEGTILKISHCPLVLKSQPDHRQEDQGPPRLNRASCQTLRRAGRREAMPQCQLLLIYPVHSRIFSLECVCVCVGSKQVNIGSFFFVDWSSLILRMQQQTNMNESSWKCLNTIWEEFCIPHQIVPISPLQK